MGEGQLDVLDHPERALRIAEGTVGVRTVRLGATGTGLPTGPGGTQALIVEAIEAHRVAVGTEELAVGVERRNPAQQRLCLLPTKRNLPATRAQ